MAAPLQRRPLPLQNHRIHLLTRHDEKVQQHKIMLALFLVYYTTSLFPFIPFFQFTLIPSSSHTRPLLYPQ